MRRRAATLTAMAALLLAFSSGTRTEARILGITGEQFTTGTEFRLTAKSGYISTPEANSILMWGYSSGTETMQFPGPTLIVNQGATVVVVLGNELAENASIVFPGQEDVAAEAVSGPTNDGLIALEAQPTGVVKYTFNAAHAGTYQYHSGTRPELQVDMGLVGALIVRPAGFMPAMDMGMGVDYSMQKAYEDPATTYTYEVLFLTSEIDFAMHRLVEEGRIAEIDNTKYFPVYWLLNGRCAPDTMHPDNVSWLPTQPYGCMPMMHPGDRLLMRVVPGGRDMHPYHHHGNNARVIARDGRPLGSQAFSGFTVHEIPGETVDAIYEWTGAEMGWDIYGHAPGDPLQPNEYAPDHGKPFPVTLPDKLDMTFGAMYSGSPFLGGMGALPPGEGGLNPFGAFVYMWHSHTEKEMTNFDIFPGGLMTMLMIVPHEVMIEH